ncbi:hypothetical protein [Streptomyces sp. NBC_01294]|uniref:hypothetical protein n=1 Tax=Streptomyces sp. NBC_01294 TaxID=2903815 RepID=UPI002DD80F08|nr:hypothetical protein [Streptomyces sp. NBC_01294]WRZ61012.1 hypothetical protein OG534_33670 [Streptomyces sp. NBC_01294]
MKVNGSNRSEQTGGPRDAPIPCPQYKVTTGIQIGRPPAGAPADPVDSRERAVLMRAFSRANTGLSAAQESLGKLGTTLLETFQATLTAIDAVERFTVGRAAGEARRQAGAVRARHTADGPEGLRRNRRLWGRLQWFMLGCSALFDFPFVGAATAQVLSVGPGGVWDTIVYGLTYLVTIGVSVLQFALGHLLGRSLFRWRVRAGRRPERVRRGARAALLHWWRPDRPRVETRRPDDLPWPGLAWPVVANLVLITFLAVTAYSRAKQSNSSAFGDGGEAMAVFLIVSLSLATLATTVLAHNPYAESDEDAKAAAAAVEERVDALVPEARRLLARHSTSWHQLRAALEQARADAHHVVDDACALIVEERAATGVAGTLELPLREYAWPVDEGRSGPATPRLQLEVLEHGDALMVRYDPSLLENWLEDTVEELNIQFELPDIEPPVIELPDVEVPGAEVPGAEPTGIEPSAGDPADAGSRGAEPPPAEEGAPGT